jgi:RHS repeat-associated protein
MYDSATVNSHTMVNARGRLAEAYTCTSSCTTKITDLGFSYTTRGQVADVYQSTPNSSGYYHVGATYWAHGMVNTLNMNLSGVPTWTIGVDGEGRASTVTASSGQNPVTNTAYNLYSSPPQTQVTLGSGDTDTFSFDPNTGRMTQYKFTVGSTPQSVVGNLTWNPNGSLATLGIMDPFNNANQQTCTYSHDDLSRIASVNCGASVWQQNFTYDPFGNITKTVPTGGTGNSFQPTYSPTTNRITALPGFTPSYDANGNVLSDSLDQYTWNAEGRPVTMAPYGGGTVSLTFDALGRMVEQSASGGYTQIVYGPSGSKLALMSGQTLTKAFVPLPGGATAVYNSSGLAYYRHADWLGSSRFASTPSRTMYGDVAYAPFGEPYAQAGTTDLSFTGQNSDTAGGSFDFLFREYSIQGRWPSPDPAGMGAVSLSNPQSWNRYAYVLNNPMRLLDPNGLCGVDGQHVPGPCQRDRDNTINFPPADLYCGLDGGTWPCHLVADLLQSGVAGVCPNNNCNFITLKQDGNWYKLVAVSVSRVVSINVICPPDPDLPCKYSNVSSTFTVHLQIVGSADALTPSQLAILGNAYGMAGQPVTVAFYATLGVAAIAVAPEAAGVVAAVDTGGLYLFAAADVYGGALGGAMALNQFVLGITFQNSTISYTSVPGALGALVGKAYTWITGP